MILYARVMFSVIWITVLFVRKTVVDGLGFLALSEKQNGLEVSKAACFLPPEVGPCEYFREMWYYSSQNDKCYRFRYGGCLGNENKFMNKKECKKRCQKNRRSTKKQKSRTVSVKSGVCLLPQDTGFCIDTSKGAWWWYYDGKSKTCQQFWFSGCGGNQNRFRSRQDCEKACDGKKKVHKAKPCEACDKRTSICVKHSRTKVTCKCKPGFIQNSKEQCVDEDECLRYRAKCSPQAWCQNTVGSYKCVCFAGYRGNGKKCNKIPEEDSNRVNCRACHKDAACEDGRFCRCKQEFTGDGYHCKDVNECLDKVSPCSVHAKCGNTPGSYTCTCYPGYAGNGYNCTNSPDACFDAFDEKYRRHCGKIDWNTRYYYDQTIRTCRRFWYTSCAGKSRNIFTDLQTCESLCKKVAYPLARIYPPCFAPANHDLKSGCTNTDYEEKYFFNHATKNCEMFWYDKCHHGAEKNVFQDLETCRNSCEKSKTQGLEYKEENSNDVQVVQLKNVKATLTKNLSLESKLFQTPLPSTTAMTRVHTSFDAHKNEVWSRRNQEEAQNLVYTNPYQAPINVSITATIQASEENFYGLSVTAAV